MRSLKSAVFFVAATLGTITSAFGGAGVITTTVTPLSTNVTYSIATPKLDTYIGYTVQIENAGGNTVNNIVFSAAAVVTDAQESATFSSAEGATCMVDPADSTSIRCTIGQLSASTSYPTFALFYKAPAKDKISPMPDGALGDCGNTDCVSFSGITYYAEGTGGLENSVPLNSTKSWSATAVALGTANPSLVKSSVPKGGGNFFTGSGGVTTGTDPFATTVSVPAAATYTTAQIEETPLTLTIEPNCSNFVTCYKSQIDIPTTADFSPYLTIVLRMDAANIKKGTKIGGVAIYYEGALVGECPNPTTPLADGVPCIADRTYYKNPSVPGWTSDLDGDFEWRILNLRNGGYKVL